MGCPKLTYYDNDIEALEKNFFFTTECLEKKVCRRKNRLDYYPFGMPMPGRNFSSNQYRYGYQGSEKDNEITGADGSHITTHFRQLDTRIARWWGVDPKTKTTAWESPYASMGNNPISRNDPMGDKWKDKYAKQEGDNLMKVFVKNRAAFAKKAAKSLAIINQYRADGVDTKSKEYQNELLNYADNMTGEIVMATAITELLDMGSEDNLDVFDFDYTINRKDGLTVSVSLITEGESKGFRSYTIHYQHGNVGNKAHETKHGYDLSKCYTSIPAIYKKGEKSTQNFKMTSDQQWDLEKAGFMRQYFTDPTSFPSNLKIDTSFDIRKNKIRALNPEVYKF